MLVVDRSVFAEFEADQAGLDFMELSANLIRAHRHGGRQQYASTPSILDSEATSKILSDPCTPVGMSPPAYEDICDLPPSYSELGLSVCVQSIKQSSSSTNSHHQQQKHIIRDDAQVEADEQTSSTGSYVMLRVSSDTDVHQGCYYEASKTRSITKQLSL